VRFLLKALAGLRKVMSSKSTGVSSSGAKAAAASLPPALEYLGAFVGGKAPPHCRATSQAEMGQPAVLQEAYDHRAGRLLVELEQQLASLEAKGVSAHQG
jgi:hypothetical protein